MDFDSDKIVLRSRLRDSDGRLPHAESDLQDARREAPEYPIEVERRAGERNPKRGKQELEGAPLRGRNAPLSQDETAHRAVRCLVAGRR